MLDAGKDGKRIPPRGCGLYGVRRQAKRDAALASEARLEMDTAQTQAKAASRFACSRTPYGCGRHGSALQDALIKIHILAGNVAPAHDGKGLTGLSVCPIIKLTQLGREALGGLQREELLVKDELIDEGGQRQYGQQKRQTGHRRSI